MKFEHADLGGQAEILARPAVQAEAHAHLAQAAAVERGGIEIADALGKGAAHGLDAGHRFEPLEKIAQRRAAHTEDGQLKRGAPEAAFRKGRAHCPGSAKGWLIGFVIGRGGL